MTKIELGERIAAARKAQRITIRQMAELAKANTRTIQAVEKGKYNVGIDTYLNLAEALGLQLLI